jgi:2-oxoglutarate dehydrogenase E1 component
MAHRGRLERCWSTSSARILPRACSRNSKGAACLWCRLRRRQVPPGLFFQRDDARSARPIWRSLFNPSHLEIVTPVVAGSVRARQDRRNDPQGDQVVPVIDPWRCRLCRAGRGDGDVPDVADPRLTVSAAPCTSSINNQVGFTTSRPDDARSTEYCTDVAKMVQAPIFHVNGDDPEAVLFVTQLAVDYRRNAFRRDVVIDLVCYRRRGHNEADEPSGHPAADVSAKIRTPAETRCSSTPSSLVNGGCDRASERGTMRWIDELPCKALEGGQEQVARSRGDGTQISRHCTSTGQPYLGHMTTGRPRPIRVSN